MAKDGHVSKQKLQIIMENSHKRTNSLYSLAGWQCKVTHNTLHSLSNDLNGERNKTAVLGNVSLQNVGAWAEDAFKPRTV